MKYSIDYQQLHKGQKRPSDDGDIVSVTFDSESGFALIPNVGDVVNIPEMRGRCGEYGVVKCRLLSICAQMMNFTAGSTSSLNRLMLTTVR